MLDTISRHMKDKKIIRNSQHSFPKGRSCLTSLTNLYDEMTDLAEVRAVAIFYTYFSDTFTVCKILVDKLLMYRLDEKTLTEWPGHCGSNQRCNI